MVYGARVKYEILNENVFDVLDFREKRVLKLRSGIETGNRETLREIADVMGLPSADCVRRIEQQALNKLKLKKPNAVKFYYEIK